MDQFFMGEIFIGGWDFAARGSAYCNGEILSINSYQSLYSLLGTTFGGDGRTSFKLPDLRGRVPINTGSGAGLTPRQMGSFEGVETNTLSIANMPPHTHDLLAAPGTATTGTAAGNVLAHETRGSSDLPDIYEDATPTINMHENCLTSIGNGTPVNNMQPYLVIPYYIVLDGIFPPRN